MGRANVGLAHIAAIRQRVGNGSNSFRTVPSGADEIGEVGEGRPHGIDDGAAREDLGSMFQ